MDLYGRTINNLVKSVFLINLASLTVFALFTPAQVSALELESEIGVELRYFSHATDHQHQENPAFHLEIGVSGELGQIYWEFLPYYLHDANDDRRTHGDIRELYIAGFKGNIEWKAGITRVFWGAAESVHLVDIINQKNLITQIEGEVTLGQPLVNLSYQSDIGLFESYFMPCYREQELGDKQSRLRFVNLEFDPVEDLECHESENTIDWALRWSKTLGNTDVALGYFDGTRRTPTITINNAGMPLLSYGQLRQASLELTKIHGNWIYKFEGVSRNTEESGTQNERNTYAWVGGGEYTFSGVGKSRADLGLIVEYQYDQASTSISDDDLFVGTRFALNDFSDTNLLLGGTIDLNDKKSRIFKIEVQRRVGDSGSIEVNGYHFSSSSNDASPSTNRSPSPESLLDREDFFSLTYKHFF